MPKIPTIQPKVQAPGPTQFAKMPATPNVLAPVAEGLSQAAQVIQAAETRKRIREDTISRAFALNDYKEEMQARFSKIKSEGNLGRRETFQSFHTEAQEIAAKYLGEHEGSPDSQAELAVALEDARGKFVRTAYDESIKEQLAITDETFKDLGGSLAAAAGNDPSSIDDQYVKLDRELEVWSAGLDPQQELEYDRTIRSGILTSAATTAIDTKNYEQAKAVLSRPEASEVLSPESLRTLRSKIVQGEYADQKEAKAFEVRKVQGEQVFGKPWAEMSVQERAATQRMSLPAHAVSASDEIQEKVTAYRDATGSDPDETAMMGIINSVTGAKSADNPFGTGDSGARLYSINSYKSKLDSNSMTKDDVFALNTLIKEEYKPQTIVNPALRESYLYYPEIDPDIVQGMQRAGLPVPLNGVMVPLKPEGGLEERKYPPRESRRGVAGSATHLAGPFATIARFISAAPGAGGFTDADRKSAETNLIAARRQLVDFLQTSPRNAETERTAIEEDVKLDPSAWDNATNLQNTALGWYDVVMDHLSEAEEIERASRGGEGPQPSLEMVNRAKNMLFAGPSILRKLGIRRTSDMPKDPTQLQREIAEDPPGTIYYDEERGIVLARDEDGPTVHKIRDL